MSDRLRLFVALDLPQDVRRALAAWAAHAAPDGVRPVRERNLHLTLAFLGSRSQEQADAIAALLPSVAAPVGELRTAGAMWLGPRRPTVLAVALAGTSPLQSLRTSLVEALADAVGFEPEQRSFRPHVTVARVARGARMGNTKLPAAPAAAFEAEALTLYRSCPEPGGSRYEPLARESLGSRPFTV